MIKQMIDMKTIKCWLLKYGFVEKDKDFLNKELNPVPAITLSDLLEMLEKMKQSPELYCRGLTGGAKLSMIDYINAQNIALQKVKQSLTGGTNGKS